MPNVKDTLKNVVESLKKRQVVKPENVKRLERVIEEAQKAGKAIQAEKEK